MTKIISCDYINERTKELNRYSSKVNNIFDVLVKVTKDFKLQKHHELILEDKDFKGVILDIGSHFCVFDIVAKLKDDSRQIHCLDGSEIACTIGAQLKKKSEVNINILCGLVEQEPYKENMFDCIVMIQTLEHIKDLDGLFIWLNKILKPTGFIYIVIPYQKSHIDPDHCNFFSIKDDTSYINIMQFLKNKGYTANGFVYKEDKKCHADIFLKCFKDVIEGK